MVFALLELPNLTAGAARIVAIVAGLLLLTVIVLLTAPWLAAQVLRLLQHALDTFGYGTNVLADTVDRWGTQAVATLSLLRSIRVYAFTLGWSLLVWLCTFAWFGAFLTAIGLPQRYPLVIVGATFASLAKALPFITIGGFGAHEAGWTLGFSLTGMATATAITSGFAVNILTLLMSVICGGAALLFLSMSIRRATPPVIDATGEAAVDTVGFAKDL